MSDPLVRVTIVNHVSVDMPAPQESVWRRICDDYLAGERFRAAGFKVQRLNDPSAVFGGYRLLRDQEGSVDERLCYVTELCQSARRLSLFVDFLSVPDGFTVYVTYQAKEIAAGASFALDSHTRTSVARPSPGSERDLRAVVAELTDTWDAALRSHLEGLRNAMMNSVTSEEV